MKLRTTLLLASLIGASFAASAADIKLGVAHALMPRWGEDEGPA